MHRNWRPALKGKMKLAAKDIMSRNVVTVPADMPLAELERVLLENRIGGAPVVDQGKVVGVISRSDIVKQAAVGQAIADYAMFDYYRDISGFSAPAGGRLPAPFRVSSEKLLSGHLANTRVRDAMVDCVIGVAPDATVRMIAAEMINEGIHRVLVVDAGRLVGVVTSLDLVGVLARAE